MIIGISLRSIIIDNKKKKFVNQTYLDYLKKYNLIPLLLDVSSFEHLAFFCDGFLLTGGYDIDPKCYRHDNINSINIDEEMDLLDFKILEYAKKYKKPCFGICRGLQAINVYFKGTLNQNLDKIHHNNISSKLVINKSNYFPSLNKQTLIVNSYHHQGIDKLGKGLKNVGTSEGVIEVIEHNKLPIIGIQFHIELLNDSNLNEIFLSFIELIKKYKVKRLNVL